MTDWGHEGVAYRLPKPRVARSIRVGGANLFNHLASSLLYRD